MTTRVTIAVTLLILLIVASGLLVAVKLRSPSPASTNQAITPNPTIATSTAPVSTVIGSTSTISIPEMSEYVDNQFGFSFWYPSQWKVSPVGISNLNYYGQATTSESLMVYNPQNENGFSLDAVSGGSLTSPKDKTCAATYYFDNATNQWMVALSLCDGTSTSTADALAKTMDGLPIFPGAASLGIEVIVPINATKFIDITYVGSMDYLSRINVLPFVETIENIGAATSSRLSLPFVEAESKAYLQY